MSRRYRVRLGWLSGALRTKGAVALALLIVVATLRTDRLVEAARPGELARLVPAEPLVLLESDDLPGLIGRWRDCRLRRDVEATEVYRRCGASRVILRLGERRDLLEAVLAEPLSWDRLASLPGNRGGLALYNVGETSFVMWLRTHHGAGDDLEMLRPGLQVERSEPGGHRVVIHRGGDDSSPLAAAVVGDLLILSNDLEIFQRALGLASGEQIESLLSDTTYTAMARQAPANADVHLFLEMSRLRQTRQFRRYWVHNNEEELRGIDRAMLSLTMAENQTIENRIIAYQPNGERMSAGQERTSDEGSSAEERLAALPRVNAAYTSLRDGDAAAAASAARWLWPGTAENEEGSEVLRELLERGHVTRIVEVIRPRLGRDGFSPTDQLAVAVALETPNALSTRDVVDAGALALTGALEGVGESSLRPTIRRTTAHGVTVRTISPLLPGLRGLSVSRSRNGVILVLSNSQQLAGDLASLALSTTPLGQALAVNGPNVESLDFTQTRRVLRRRLGLIATPETSDASNATDFLGDDIPELLGVPRISRIERVTHRSGDFDHQTVRYIH